jgi:hypothetical protein
MTLPKAVPGRTPGSSSGTGPEAWSVTITSATARALDYSLKRWVALTRYLDDGMLPIDNNRIVSARRTHP